MPINPMELLKQYVSSVIIGEQSSLINEKNDVLSRFYVILLSRFLVRPELIDSLREKLTPSISDLLENNDHVKNMLLLRLAAGKIPVHEVEITLNRAIPKSLAVLSSHIGNDAVTIIHYLREHRLSIQALLPVWCADTLLPLDHIEPPILKEEIIQSVASSPITQSESAKPHRVFPFLTLIFVSFSLIWLYQLSR